MRWNEPVVVDFETYYDQEFSLSKITTERYIRGEEFETIGVSVKIGHDPVQFFPRETGVDYLRQLAGVPGSVFVSHNATFDMGILAHRYGIHPDMMVDTVMLARTTGLDRVAGSSSLFHLSKWLVAQGLVSGQKGDAVHDMKGVHADDMTPEQWESYAEYCKWDTELCSALYHHLIGMVPVSELEMCDITLKMWTHATIDLDVELLTAYLGELDAAQDAMLEDLAHRTGYANATELLKTLRSPTKFSNLLEYFGAEVPMKWSEKQGKEVPALAKTDLGLLALLEGDDPFIAELVQAKLDAGSSIERTRSARFIDIASRGRMPVPLTYAGAHTGRYGGAGSINIQNLSKRSGKLTLRRSLRAPEGYAWVACDSSQIEARLLAFVADQRDLVDTFASGRDVYIDMATKIYGKTYEEIKAVSKGQFVTKEGKAMRNTAKTVVLGCIGEDMEVLTNQGWIAIQDVTTEMQLWDGEEFVPHDGVVCSGHKYCIEVNGVTLTPDHKVFTGSWSRADTVDPEQAVTWAEGHMPDKE